MSYTGSCSGEGLHVCAALISVPRLPRGTVNAAICSLMWEVTREYRGRRVSTLLATCGPPGTTVPVPFFWLKSQIPQGRVRTVIQSNEARFGSRWDRGETASVLVLGCPRTRGHRAHFRREKSKFACAGRANASGGSVQSNCGGGRKEGEKCERISYVRLGHRYDVLGYHTERGATRTI